MKEIIFPAINLNLKINPVAIKFLGIDIYWYAIIIIVAIIIAIILCKRDEGKYNILFEDIVNLSLLLIPISIICARLYYVLFRLEYYITEPLKILNIRDGGLAIYGGIIGGFITVCIYSKYKKIKFFDIVDYIIPYLALGQAIGRWGNFFNQEAYGIQTSSIFRMGIIEGGRYIEVHPTFLYESIGSLIIFIILYLMRDKRKYQGQITYMYLALYGLLRFFIEGIRADSLMVGSYKISQVISLELVIIFGLILIYKKIKSVGAILIARKNK